MKSTALSKPTESVLPVTSFRKKRTYQGSAHISFFLSFLFFFLLLLFCIISHHPSSVFQTAVATISRPLSHGIQSVCWYLPTDFIIATEVREALQHIFLRYRNMSNKIIKKTGKLLKRQILPFLLVSLSLRRVIGITLMFPTIHTAFLGSVES